MTMVAAMASPVPSSQPRKAATKPRSELTTKAMVAMAKTTNMTLPMPVTMMMMMMKEV